MKAVHPQILAEAKRLASDNARSLVTLVDQEGVLLFVSRPAAESFGYGVNELLGRRFADFIDPRDVDHLFLAIQDAFLNEVSVEVSARTRTKSGEYRAMRGVARLVVDPETGEAFFLSRAEAVE